MAVFNTPINSVQEGNFKLCKRRQTVRIPVQLSCYVYENNLAKPFAMYLYLKCNSDGIIRLERQTIEAIRRDLSIKTKSTFDKRLNKLIELNWIGYNASSGLLFIRAFHRVKRFYGFHNPVVSEFDMKSLPNLKAYLGSVIISRKIKSIEHYAKKKRLRKSWGKAAIYNDHIAIHPDPTHPQSCFLYFGLCANYIGELLKCEKSKANKLKLDAVKAGFLKTRKHYGTIANLPKAYDKHQILAENPEYMGKLRFRTFWDDRKSALYVKALVQWHDEIEPQIQFRLVGNLKRIIGANQLRKAMT